MCKILTPICLATRREFLAAAMMINLVEKGAWDTGKYVKDLNDNEVGNGIVEQEPWNKNKTMKANFNKNINFKMPRFC